MNIIYQISMVSGAGSTAWIDVTKEQYDDAGIYPEFARRAVVREFDVVINNDTGISLRDYFAANAMQSLIVTVNQYDEPWHFGLTKEAYQIADAMIKARGEV